MSTEIVARIGSVKQVEYRGERVITLSMMDDLHERPNGTAGRNFRKHRGKLLEGRDYFEIDQPDEIRRLGLQRNDGSTQEKLVLLSEYGYLMLVKSFRDDRAWEVQRGLVEHYFRSTQQLASGHLAYIGQEIARGIREGLKPVDGKIDDLKETVDRHGEILSDLSQKVNAFERRRDLSASTKRQHIDTIEHFFSGRCPCCHSQDVTSEHAKLPNAEWEHWFSKSKNQPHETWLVCHNCNIRLRDDGAFKRNQQLEFDSYQKRREQKSYPLLGFAE